MMTDILLVGAGLTTATIVSALRDTPLSMRIVECRNHIAGNCYDYTIGSDRVSLYGRHIIHTKTPAVLEHLQKFDPLEDSGYTLEAEIEWHDRIWTVPVPFQPAVETILRAPLTDEEILDCYFRGYSFKQWGVAWDDLPAIVKGRVPRRGDFFRNKSRLRPKFGYTAMISKMLGNTPVLLNAHPDYWRGVPARKIVFCGRADLLTSHRLPYRNMLYEWHFGRHAAAADGLNYCHLQTSCVRSMTYGPVTCYETAAAASSEDPTPAYPFPTAENLAQYAVVKAEVEAKFPNLILAGRLGAYKYYDMDMAVAAGLELAQQLRQELL